MRAESGFHLRRGLWAIILCAALRLVANAQPPAIAQNGVVNSASQIPSALPLSSIARGAKFTIYGVRLAAKTPVSPEPFGISVVPQIDPAGS